MNTPVRCPKPRPSVTDPTPTTSPASAHHQLVIERLAAIDVVKASGSPHDLGPDYHTNRIVTQRRVRNHIAQLTALGYRVTLEPAA